MSLANFGIWLGSALLSQQLLDPLYKKQQIGLQKLYEQLARKYGFYYSPNPAYVRPYIPHVKTAMDKEANIAMLKAIFRPFWLGIKPWVEKAKPLASKAFQKAKSLFKKPAPKTTQTAIEPVTNTTAQAAAQTVPQETLKDTIRSALIWTGIGTGVQLGMYPIMYQMEKEKLRKLYEEQAKLMKQYGFYASPMLTSGMPKTSSIKTAAAFQPSSVFMRQVVQPLSKAMGAMFQRGAAIGGALLVGSEFIKNLAKTLKQKHLTAANLAALTETLAKKHPDWDKEQIRRYLVTIYKYAPAVLADQTAAEEIITRVMNYGGLDPAFLKELVELNNELLR